MTEEKTPRELLIEMSQELALARADLRTAERRAEELRGPYEAATSDSRKCRSRVERIEQGIDTLKLAYAISVAVSEMGIETAAAPVIVVNSGSEYRKPDVFELAAIGSEGTALYLRQPSRMGRSGGKTYAILADEPPDLDAHYYEAMRRVGLFTWEERGRGQWGAGTGSIKPKAPPEGGRWRWVKVREQALLGEGDE